jgi:hypothetical protein
VTSQRPSATRAQQGRPADARPAEGGTGTAGSRRWTGDQEHHGAWFDAEGRLGGEPAPSPPEGALSALARTRHPRPFRRADAAKRRRPARNANTPWSLAHVRAVRRAAKPWPPLTPRRGRTRRRRVCTAPGITGAVEMTGSSPFPAPKAYRMTPAPPQMETSPSPDGSAAPASDVSSSRRTERRSPLFAGPRRGGRARTGAAERTRSAPCAGRVVHGGPTTPDARVEMSSS